MDIRDDPQPILVHYCGWNTRWDEWVPISRVALAKPEEEGGVLPLVPFAEFTLTIAVQLHNRF
jgi:hypothetical protein